MADPLSILASVITVAGAAITVSDTILSFVSQLRNAPDEIMFVQNDVTDTRLVLSNITANSAEDTSLDRRLALPNSNATYGDPENILKAELLIKRMERVLLDIDLSLRKMTKTRSPNGITLNQRAWFLNRSKLRLWRQELRELKTSVAVHFSASSSTHSHRSVVLLKRVLLENAHSVQRQAERSTEVDIALQRVTQQLAELSVMPESQRQLVSLLENLNIAIVASEERSSRTTTTTTEVTAIGTDSAAMSSAGSAVTRRSSTTVTAESVSRLKLEFSRFQKRGCALECECACHQRRRYRSPSFAQKVLGELFIGFSSLPLLSKSCTDDRCTQKSTFSATFTYYLPTLLLNKMISLVFITTSQGDPAACIKVRPLSSDFSLYRAVEQNDLQTIRTMINNRSAHPSATFKGGWTPLHYAINYGHTAICKTLLAIGADPLIEDGWNQISPLEWAWTKILGGAYDSQTQVEMEQLFSDKECLEEMRFSTIHRIVLGLSSTSLETHISQNPGCINTVDSNGRTPLSWAAQRGMVEFVKTLLDFGADPNICTAGGHSPLLYAAEARTPSCLMPLLDHGADITQCDAEGQTALHYAAGHRGDLAYYRPLIEANSDPNWPTIPGMTPLTTVILEGFNEAMEYLVENGADINLKGHDGRPPVFYAVEYNNHFALQFLRDKRADFTGESVKYPTIAHVAAHHANPETLQILTTFSLMLRDIDCVDSQGLSITQIVDERLQSYPERDRYLDEAFRLFLESVKTGEGEAAEHEFTRHVAEELEDEEFHDALEHISTN